LNNFSFAGRDLCGAALAPMAGLSDLTLRTLAAEYGAVFTVSEMVSAKAIVMGDKKTRALCTPTPGQALYGIQLFGNEPEVVAEAARMLKEEFAPDFLDINMGCPAPKIVGNGCGSSLMKNPALCGRMVEGAVAAGLPVSVKMRTGFDENHMTAVEVARCCESAGASLLTVHGRTRAQQYTPPIHPEEIARVVQAVKLPVLGNGDILTAEDALQLKSQTGCAGVMVGRGALGNLWLFRQIRAVLAGEPVPPPPTLAQRMELLCRQAKGMCEEKGEETAIKQARTQAIYYLKGLRGAASFRSRATGLTVYRDVVELRDAVLAANAEETRPVEEEVFRKPILKG